MSTPRPSNVSGATAENRPKKCLKAATQTSTQASLRVTVAGTVRLISHVSLASSDFLAHRLQVLFLDQRQRQFLSPLPSTDTVSVCQHWSLMSRPNAKTITGTTSRPVTGRSRPKTAATSTGYGSFDNDIICAISESRGISPSVGLAFVNLSTCEAVLCQFTDTQTFARTCHKLKVFSPTEIIHAHTAADSKFLSIIQENLEVEKNDVLMRRIDRRYWSETAGHDYIRQLALPNDLEALKLSLVGNYFAVCCFAAVCSSEVKFRKMLTQLGTSLH